MPRNMSSYNDIFLTVLDTFFYQVLSMMSQRFKKRIKGLKENIFNHWTWTNKINMNMSMCSVMQNGFQVAKSKENCILFLFRGWDVNTDTRYAFMIIGVLAMGILNGALAYLRQRVIDYSKRSSSILLNQLYLSIIYGVNMVLAYWMMLIAMTYETGAFTALILGLVLGYFIFGYITAKTTAAEESSRLLNSAYETQFKTAPCCQTTS